MMGLIKKILLVSIIGILLYPVIYFALLYYEGQLRIEIGAEKPEMKEDVEILRYSPVQDSIAVVHSKIYESLVQQQKRVEREQRKLDKKQERMRLLKDELTEKVKTIEQTKKEIADIVKSSETLEHKRIKALANIYGSMRPNEAAPILETLPDKLIIAILRAIGEDRQKAKIIENMDKKTAARISKEMGASIFAEKTKK